MPKSAESGHILRTVTEMARSEPTDLGIEWNESSWILNFLIGNLQLFLEHLAKGVGIYDFFK